MISAIFGAYRELDERCRNQEFRKGPLGVESGHSSWSKFWLLLTQGGHEQLQSGRPSLAEGRPAALGDRNVEADIHAS
jgi:hypothetical protein